MRRIELPHPPWQGGVLPLNYTRRSAYFTRVCFRDKVQALMSWKLLGFFVLGLLIRFLYFPNDISFIYDQARDAYAAQELLHANLKIVGPPTAIPGLYHGSLFYYLHAPLLLVSHGNPEFISACMRLYNALGIILIFFVAKKIFDWRTGLISSLIFTTSFEQTQFAMFLGHPAFAVLSVLGFYYGLAISLPLAAFCLGMAIQFHFAMISLIPVFLIWLIFHRQTYSRKIYLQTLLAAVISLSTFILAEFKFHFRTLKTLSTLAHTSSGQGLHISNLFHIFVRYIQDNLATTSIIVYLVAIVLLFAFAYTRKKILILWLLAGLVPYVFDHSSIPIYYYTIGGSLSVIIMSAYLINKLPQIARTLILFFIIYTNLIHITQTNRIGVMPEITVQSGMLLSDQKQLIDAAYQQSDGQPFAINAVTIPYQINTTWSYLFEWYGKSKYGYLPIWSSETAIGYAGNLPLQTNRSLLPAKRFTIIEPDRGLDSRLKKQYLEKENIFTTVVSEKKFGRLTLQIREKK